MGLKERAAAATGGEAVPAGGGEEATGGQMRAADLADEQTMPDLSGSPVPAGMDVPVHLAWTRVMRDVQWIGKTQKARDYNYRGIDQVMQVVGPALRKHGVVVVPIGADPTYTVINTSKGAAMNYCRIVSRFQVFGPRGDSFIGETPGEAFDSGDKAATKAQSIALRTFYVQALAVVANRPELDTEHGVQHELAGPKVPTPQEYAALILDERTSIERLQQIKQELDGNRVMGATVITLVDDEQVRLADLVRRVGKARQAGG